ncbi:MAG: MJ1255/VC2487 family glycosyltransferase [Candidatus Nanoarchaeia archaeon]
MAKILYGVCGIGIGHAIRSSEVITHLRKKHEVLVLSSGTAYPHLKKKLPNVHLVPGFEFAFKKNSIQNVRTILKNIAKLNAQTYHLFKNVTQKLDQFQADLVISDMDTFSMYYAKDHQLPLITLDNQHYLFYGNYKAPDEYAVGSIKGKLALKIATLPADKYLVLSFPKTHLKPDTPAELFNPILRKEIFTVKSITRDYIFVYQSMPTDKHLINLLKKIKENFIVYGFNLEKKEGNITFKKFHEGKKYLQELANAKAIISSAGFTLLSEALYFQKPIFALPIKKHFEQTLNALYLKQHQFGDYSEEPTAEHLLTFLKKIAQKKYKTLPKWNNHPLYIRLDTIIEEHTQREK